MLGNKFKGYLLGALAAIAYGTNPAFAVPLYENGMNPNTVLLFRYILGIPILAILMKIRGISFGLPKDAIGHTFILGILMALSSLTLFESYNYMNAGVASTLLFVYPVMVAVIMVFFFHEKIKNSLYICLVLMLAGLVLLMKPEEGFAVSTMGCLLVILSAISYALYIVLVNVSKKVNTIPTTKLLFYVLTWGSLLFWIMIPCGAAFTPPTEGIDWINLTALAVIPTIISLACTTRAIQLIGSTPTAILGALEPVTAVILSVVILHQGLSFIESIGALFILIAATIVVSDTAIDKAMLHIRKMFPKHHRENL